jgi:hypothetical protein
MNETRGKLTLSDSAGVGTTAGTDAPRLCDRSEKCGDCVARREEVFPGEPFPFCWCSATRRRAREYICQLEHQAAGATNSQK